MSKGRRYKGKPGASDAAPPQKTPGQSALGPRKTTTFKFPSKTGTHEGKDPTTVTTMVLANNASPTNQPHQEMDNLEQGASQQLIMLKDTNHTTTPGSSSESGSSCPDNSKYDVSHSMDFAVQQGTDNQVNVATPSIQPLRNSQQVAVDEILALQAREVVEITERHRLQSLQLLQEHIAQLKELNDMQPSEQLTLRLQGLEQVKDMMSGHDTNIDSMIQKYLLSKSAPMPTPDSSSQRPPAHKPGGMLADASSARSESTSTHPRSL